MCPLRGAGRPGDERPDAQLRQAFRARRRGHYLQGGLDNRGAVWGGAITHSLTKAAWGGPRHPPHGLMLSAAGAPPP